MVIVKDMEMLSIWELQIYLDKKGEWFRDTNYTKEYSSDKLVYYNRYNSIFFTVVIIF